MSLMEKTHKMYMPPCKTFLYEVTKPSQEMNFETEQLTENVNSVAHNQ